MFPWEIQWSPRGFRDLSGQEKQVQRRILQDVESLAKSRVFPAPPSVKSLKGRKDVYRLCSGDYRTVFQLQKDILLILRVLHRKDLKKVLVGLT